MPFFSDTVLPLREAAAVAVAVVETGDFSRRAPGADPAGDELKTAFRSSMSHELRTPLNAILGLAQVLVSGKLPATLARKKEFANHICKPGRHLLALINEILDLAKIEAGGIHLELAPVALDEVLAECRDMLAGQAAQRGTGRVFRPACRLQLTSDRTRLRQILLNLLNNAIKYNREHGAVMVDCCAGQEGRLRATVQDTGPGLTPGQLRQLFQPFNRLGQEGGPQEGAGSSFWIAPEAAGGAAERPRERMEVGT
jgi:signal transduction histidine kinase